MRLIQSREKTNRYKIVVEMGHKPYLEISVYEDKLIEDKVDELYELIASILDSYTEEEQ